MYLTSIPPPFTGLSQRWGSCVTNQVYPTISKPCRNFSYKIRRNQAEALGRELLATRTVSAIRSSEMSKLCVGNKPLHQIDINMVCSMTGGPMDDVPGVCACRQDMRWSPRALQCQVPDIKFHVLKHNSQRFTSTWTAPILITPHQFLALSTKPWSWRKYGDKVIGTRRNSLRNCAS